MIYKVGEFEVRANERQILAHGKPIALGTRTFDLLLALIEHQDRVLGKEELMALVWPGLAVEENNLTVQMSALRKALGANDELRQAHNINPNCALTLAWLGLVEAMHGDVSVSVPHVLKALRLSPHDPSVSIFLILLGFTRFAVADYAEAAQAADAALRESPNVAVPYLVAAISWVGVGDIERAKKAFLMLQQISPKLAAARLAGQWMSDNTIYRKRAHTFLRIAAGLEAPEMADAYRQTQ